MLCHLNKKSVFDSCELGYGLQEFSFAVKPSQHQGLQKAFINISLDKLFNWDYADDYFNNNKDRTTVASFTCVLPGMPQENCFCTSVGGGPGSEEGADLLWTDLGDKFLVEAFTEKGEKVLSAGGGVFADAGAGDEDAAKDAKAKAAEAIVRKVDVEGVAEMT